MKNHWLDKKEEKEFIEALETLPEKAEFVDSDFIDLSSAGNTESRYKEYEDIKIADLFNEEFCEKQYDIRTSTDKEDRQMIKAILLKNMIKTHWVEEVLGDVGYTPHLAPGCDLGLGNLTITCGFNTNMSDVPNTSTFVGDVTISGGPQGRNGFPTDDDKSIQAGCCGDFACNCSANLDIFYPDNAFIQNEKLQVIKDSSIDITQYQTMYTPVLPATMTGTIYPTPGNTSYGFVFYVTSDGVFTFDQFVQDVNGEVEYASKQPLLTLEQLADGELDDRFMGWYDEAYVIGTTLNLQTGVLELNYHMGKQPEIIVSYEYGREC